MRFKNKELVLGVLLGAGLNLLNSLRERLPDNLDDIKTKVMDTYGTASSRVSRASDVLRGQEDSHILGKVGALLIGVGVGVGVSLLIPGWPSKPHQEPSCSQAGCLRFPDWEKK